MSLIRTICFGLLLFNLNGISLNAQLFNYSDNKKLLQNQLNKLSLVHDSIFNFRHYILNGKLYYTIGNKYNHPFFIDNTWQPGKVWSSGNVFNADMLKYDINSDYLVYLYYLDSYAYPIYLNKETVKEFIISGHYFKYLNDFEKSFKGILSQVIMKFYMMEILSFMCDGKNQTGVLQIKHTQKGFFSS